MKIKFISLLLLTVLLVTTFVSCSYGNKTLGDVAYTSNHYTITAHEMAVYRYQMGIYHFQQEYMIYQYGIAQDTQGILSSYKTAEDYALAAYPDVVETDRFLYDAYEKAEQYLVYCEGALAAGVVMEAEDVANLEKDVDTMKTHAEKLGISYDAFIEKYLGKGVTEADIRSAREKVILASKYEKIKSDEFAQSATEAELLDTCVRHKDTFYRSVVSYYQFSDTDMVEMIQECQTENELKVVLIQYVLDNKFDALYESKVSLPDIEDPNGKEGTRLMIMESFMAEEGMRDENGNEYQVHFSVNETDAYKQAGYSLFMELSSPVQKELKAIGTTSHYYVDISDKKNALTDLQKWLFAPERAVGDTTILTSEFMGKTTVTWHCTTAVMVLDEVIAPNYGEENWKLAARQIIADEKLDKWYKESLTAYQVEGKYDASEWETEKDYGYNIYFDFVTFG